ncbi:replication initiation protein, partial [Paracoccus sp. Ld10]|uniref:replication initiation protein n=1 Tax=Paracoccus sp. Ld10 TaxID=649158 RepID=UPI003865FE98
RFSNLNTWALKPAIFEINQISRLDLKVTPQKIGRTVATVEISWVMKGGGAKAMAIHQLKGHSIGRKARRIGTADAVTIEPAAFPEVGSIAYSPRWKDIKHVSGCNVDDSKIATDFRRFLTKRNISCSAANIETLFGDFCRKVGKI